MNYIIIYLERVALVTLIHTSKNVEKWKYQNMYMFVMEKHSQLLFVLVVTGVGIQSIIYSLCIY